MSKVDEILAKVRQNLQIRRRADGSLAVRTLGAAKPLDPALRALAARASARLHAKPDPYAAFSPVARTPLLQQQICRHCGGEQTIIAGELLHMRKHNGTTPTDIWAHRATHLADLPIEAPIWAPPQSVARCPRCLESAPLRCEEHSGQIPLFH